MASSDEEGEIVPDYVTNYYFVNSKEEPISFAMLPILWSENESPESMDMEIYLRGTADSGLQSIYKKVIAWKFELCYEQPEIFVLSKEKNWIKLVRPRESFKATIVTILFAIHFLHAVKKNSNASADALWDHCMKEFSSYEVQPSVDLLDYIFFISEAARRDEDRAKFEYVNANLLELHEKRKSYIEDNGTKKKSNFIVDKDDDRDSNGKEDGDTNDDEGSTLYDSLCALCDNGGEILCCEGRCIRSFHPTRKAGVDSACESLGYTNAQVEAIENFLCKNCQYQLHQCFICGKLGSSNKSSGQEVFPCIAATCSHFYHPLCVAESLHPRNKALAEELQKKITAGGSFTCPAHKCFLCNQIENKKVYELQFAVCRRCPKSYHRKCLPWKIAFGGNDKNEPQRAWDGLLKNHILIYCMDHPIIPELGTPERNHILFPDVDKRKHHSSGLLSSKEKVEANESSGNLARTVYNTIKGSDIRLEKGISKPIMEKKFNKVFIKSSKNIETSASQQLYKSSTVETANSSLANCQSNSSLNMRTPPAKSKQQNNLCGKTGSLYTSQPVTKKSSSKHPSHDNETENRIAKIINDATASFNIEEFIKEQNRLVSNPYSRKPPGDSKITSGKVEASVMAVRAALKKLEEGCTIEDAQAVCKPEILKQIIRWKTKLGVYLAPFLHGKRYTSFGRHFTKSDKLKEIVDRLHWYVQDGDMIVDFSCGSNDFSGFMKEKLDKFGKMCLFKNYDLIQPKNDFNFEKRDWCSVDVKELPPGNNLIIGLNPPFGVRAALAKTFIEKALEFGPKLLILIVPKETKNFIWSNTSYDLIWEDNQLLSGKSFYLPGSVSTRDKQLEQWNVEPPPLYLWSHPDWCVRHRAIAQEHGHVRTQPEVKQADDIPEEFDDTETERPRTILYNDENWQFDTYGIGLEDSDRHYETKPFHQNLQQLQYEDSQELGQNETSVITSPMHKQDDALNLETDWMQIDMDLSTPSNSPPKDLQSLQDDQSCQHPNTPSNRQELGFSARHSEFGEENAEFQGACSMRWWEQENTGS